MNQACVYTTQGNMVCGGDARDAFVQTQFRKGCPVVQEKFVGTGPMNQLTSSFKAASGHKIENFATVPGKSTVDVSIDLEGTYGLPWAPF